MLIIRIEGVERKMTATLSGWENGKPPQHQPGAASYNSIALLASVHKRRCLWVSKPAFECLCLCSLASGLLWVRGGVTREAAEIKGPTSYGCSPYPC